MNSLLEMSMGGIFLLSFKARAKLCTFRGEPAIESWPLLLPLRSDPLLLDAAKALASGPRAAQEWFHRCAVDAGQLPKRLDAALRDWDAKGLLCRTLIGPTGKLASVVPLTQRYSFACVEPEPQHAFWLSRFAYSRRREACLALESPLGHARVELYDWRASAILHEFTAGATLEQLEQLGIGLPHSAIKSLLGVLVGAGMVSPEPDREGRSPQEDGTLEQWAFHDLLFHSRSRLGRHDEPYGKTERFRGRLPPLPPIKPAMAAKCIPLPRPNDGEANHSELPFGQVLEARRSTRQFGNRTITLPELGQFLFRSARSKARSDGDAASYERDDRPYPSGGACYELEIYIASSSDSDLPPGLYHYEPRSHALSPLAAEDSDVRALIEDARRSAGIEPRDDHGPAPLFIVLAARFQRVAWAYESIAYALVLKHVGVLLQTMYLVGTTMGLGVCALGGGDSERFAEATGLDYMVEGSVGELLLGHPKAPSREA